MLSAHLSPILNYVVQYLPLLRHPLVCLARRSTLPACMDSLNSKLNPSRFPGMSPLMAAIVGYVLQESFTDPEIAEIRVSETENLVYFRQAGSVRFEGLQSLVDLRNNWNRLIDVAGLTPGQRKEAVALFVARVEKVAGTEL